MTPRSAIGFLRSCVLSGEKLSKEDEAAVARALENLKKLEAQVEDLKTALAMVAWHVVEEDDKGVPVCCSCLASDTKEDNCPVMGVVERIECPFDEDGTNPLPPVVKALDDG